MEIKPDPEDGLPALEAGEWAEEKHGLLREYLNCSHGARRMFVNGRGGATYIELFAGPGRIFLKGTDRFGDGSPLIAHREAARTNTAFTQMHLGDDSSEFCTVLSQRLGKLGARSFAYPAPAATAVEQICKSLSRHAYHFAFLDPFKIDGLPFFIIERLSHFKRMDVLIHVSAMDIQRNLRRYVQSRQCPLDDFDPGWREAVKGHNPSDIVARGILLEHWVSRIQQLGFEDAEVKHLIRGPSNQPLYWLVFVAKHELATEFWDSITNSKKQNLELF